MNASLLLWLLLATMVFWTVGVYNRLMRLRARGWDALGSVDKCMTQQVVLVNRQFGGAEDADLRLIMADASDTQPTWTNFLNSILAQDEALRKLRAHPLAAEPMQALALAADATQNEWLHLRSSPADLAGSAIPDEMAYEWDALADKCRVSRGGLNQILASYDAAIALFPARLLAGFMGFEPVGRL
jgi:LemA protein